MRGWLSFFSKERDLVRYRTGVFVASAEPDVFQNALATLEERFPHVLFTFLVPQRYAELSWLGEVIWIEEIKASPVRWLASLRRRRLDLCVVLLAGRPTFRKTKCMAWLLNARRTIIYDEHGDSFVLDRANWKALLKHIGRRLYTYRPGFLFLPVGFIYLVGRSLWLSTRAKHGVPIGKVRSRP
jgi:hypothetical protein